MEVESTNTSSLVPPSTTVIIEAGSRDSAFVKEGDHMILVSNDKRNLFGVAKTKG